MPSRAIACNSRGAPVKLCSPAPQQEKNEPITMTQGEGQDSVPITRFPFTESPNLQCKNLLDLNYLFSHMIWYLTLNIMSNNLKYMSGDFLCFPFVLISQINGKYKSIYQPCPLKQKYVKVKFLCIYWDKMSVYLELQEAICELNKWRWVYMFL